MDKKNSYDYSKLLGKIKECGLTQDRLADKMGLSVCSLNLSLCNRRDFRQHEIIRIAEILGIDLEDVVTYFFAHKL